MANKPKRSIRSINNLNRNISSNINNILTQLSTMTVGTPQNTDVEDLNAKFSEIMKSETNNFNRQSSRDTASFISDLFKDSKDRVTPYNNLITQLDNIFDDSTNEGSIRSFIDEAYRNRMLKQSDIHEVASQLIELREAILITRDAIISSDIVEGKMTRSLRFRETGSSSIDELINKVEALEDKFKLQNKIKNFIIPKALEYGEYYAYVIPYKKIFGDFMKRKEDRKLGFGTTSSLYFESTLYDIVNKETDEKTHKNAFMENMNAIFESTYESVYEPENTEVISRVTNLNSEPNKKTIHESYDEKIQRMLKNVIICNEAKPLNVLEEGEGSINYFMERGIDLSTFNEEKNIRVDNIGTDAYFNQVIKSPNGDGVYSSNPYGKKSEREKGYTDGKNDPRFKNIHDCYLKVIDPIRLIPIQIMSKRIGYYYIQSEEITPVTGVVSSSLYYNRFEDSRREQTIVDAIASEIVRSFDKKFLEDNLKFKELIVEALSYFNLNEQRVRFQFIPEEYIVAFKVAEDENGNGTSIIEPSLFYAKLYLMLLLFKMMSIILYSNDTRVNYVRTSGIDKNVRKKIEEIARIKQQRSITVMDMFSYTALVNKLGVGAETYIPTGKSGERGIETEILQGQQVDLNTDLMDRLRKNYILGTGVPDAIMNYMNEADFAKSLELANTRFQGRVVSYQYDFNEGITELYKKLMRWSTDIDETDIDGFEFSFSPPKISNSQIKSDFINNFQTYSEFIINMLIGQQNADNPDLLPIINKMKLELAKDYMPMINFDSIIEMFKKSNIDGIEEILVPKGKEDIDEDLENI